MDIKGFKAWAESKNLSTDGETGRNGSYTFYDSKTQAAWDAWQAKAQAVPEVITIGNELQSWVAVNSFSADDGEGVLPVVDANALAEVIEKLTGASQ